jgi:tetratricopeptide (TPR) repeat protein
VQLLAALSYFYLPAKPAWVAQIAQVPEPYANTELEDLSERALVISDAQFTTYVLPGVVASYLRQQQAAALAHTADRLNTYVYDLLQQHGGFNNLAGFQVLEERWPLVAAALPLYEHDTNARFQLVCQWLYSFLSFSGRWDEKLALHAAGEKVAVAASDWLNAGWRAYGMAFVYRERNQTRELLECAQRIKTYWAGAGPRERVFATRLDGQMAMAVQDYSAAVAAYRESLSLQRALDPDGSDVALALNSLAGAETRVGDFAAAEQHYRDGLDLARQKGFLKNQAHIACNLARLAVRQQHWAEAETRAREAFVLLESFQSQDLSARNCLTMAQALVCQGRPAEGLPYASRAVELYLRMRSSDLAAAQAVLKECGG